jgi:hypothetical protein
MAFANEYSVCAYWLHGGVAVMGFATADDRNIRVYRPMHPIFGAVLLKSLSAADVSTLAW